MFVTFEGPNGVGKSSVMEAVAKVLIEQGFDVTSTREPTKSALGEFFRNLDDVYNGECLACIAAADRYFHIKNEISPALLQNKIVFSDRYIESSLVLQRMDGCTTEFIWDLHQLITIPDLSVILVANPLILEQRLSKRSTFSRFERTHSREEEVSLYNEAAEFILQHGFNVLKLNNDEIPIEDVVNKIVIGIMSLFNISEVNNL